MKKNLLKDILVFVVITVAASLSLAMVNSITKDPIARQNEKIIQDSYRSVFKEGQNFDNNKQINQLVKNFPNVVIDDVLVVTNDKKELIGHVVKVTTEDGYGGDITLVVGIDTNDEITGIEVLSIDETVGLGMNAKNDNFKNQYYHKSVTDFKITKTGKQNEDEIDALSGATITSSAFNNAINGALAINQEIKEANHE